MDTCGTAQYMSPEQAAGRKYDLLVDVWAVGVCLYRSLFGEMPYKPLNEKRSPAAFRSAISKGGPPSFRHSSNKTVPKQAEDVARRLLQRQATQRPAAEEVLSLDLSILDAAVANRLEGDQGSSEQPSSKKVTSSSVLFTIQE